MIDPVDFAGRHFSQIDPVPTEGIVISAEVRGYCQQNSCGKYGRNWACPPAVAPLDHFRKTLADFDTMLILREVYPVKDSFDWNGMMAGAKQFRDKLLALKKEIESFDADFRFLILGAGACHLCEPCNYVYAKPCRHPQDAIVSLEAGGIDVMRLLKDNGLKYYHGKGTVAYVGGLLYNEHLQGRKDLEEKAGVDDLTQGTT